MPRLSSDDQVKRATRTFPLLELRDFYFETAPAGELGHPLVRFNAEDLASSLLERSSGDAGADTHVEDITSGTRSENRVDHGYWIRRARPLVALGLGPEGLGEPSRLMSLTRHRLGRQPSGHGQNSQGISQPTW